MYEVSESVGQELFFKIFHASMNPMMISSVEDGMIIEVNKASLKIAGCARDDLVGRKTSDVYIWVNSREEVVRALRSGGTADSFTALYRKATGELMPIRFSSHLIRLDNRECLLSSMVDAKEEMEARALRISEEKYRMLVENSLQGLSIIQGFHFVFCNRRLAEMFGYSIEELLAFSTEEMAGMLHPEDRPWIANLFRKRLAGKPVPSRYECRCLKKDGSEFWVEILASAFEYNGKPAVQLAYIDITDRKRAEASERVTSERLKLALEAAGMTSWDLDLITGSVVDDDKWLQKLGYAPGEIEPNIATWDSLVHPEDLPILKAAAHAHTSGRSPIYEVEHRLRNKAGSWIWVMVRGKIIARDSSGKPLRTVGVHMDVTEQKLAVEQMRQMANQQKAILNTISIGINYVKDGKVQWANPAFLKMFGYTTEELQTLEIASLYPAQVDYQRMKDDCFLKFSQGQTYSTEIPMKCKEGTPLWCSVAGQAINPKDLDEGSIWVFQDITGRHKAEEALRESEERFRRLLQNSNDIIIIIDERGFLKYVSGTIERIMGYQPEDLVGIDVAANIHPDDLDSALNMMSQLRQKPGTTQRVEVRYKHKDGQWVPIEIVGCDLLHDPVVSGVVLNIREISERNRLQQQLQQAMKMEAIGVLAGGVAHDFNNLLSVINGYAELLLEDFDPDDSRREDLEQIAKAGKRAATLTSQLLAFSRKQILQPENVNLNTVVAEMSTMLCRMIGEDIELVTIPGPDLGIISADPGQIQQIIMNIVVNARDAMPNGGRLTIETSNVDIDDDFVREHPMMTSGPYVMLAISDNGIGMSRDTQARVFEPFFTTKEKGKGTGLGLSTVYGIVKQSNGFIWLYSEAGKGTTFKIYLPRTAAKEVSVRPASRDLQQIFKGQETILLAEDEESVGALASRILTESGYSVLQAKNAIEALQISRNFQGTIDLVVTDVVMPVMSGRALVSELEKSRPGIKSLFISGYTDGAIVHHGLLDSDIAFLQKPFTVESLIRKVREVIQS